MDGSSTAGERSWRYRGWRVVVGLFVVEMSIFGFGLYGQGIYLTELRRLNGWSTGSIATGTTLCLVLGSLLSMFVSDLLRWIGPCRLVLGGVAALTAGLTLLASAASLIQLYVGFFVLALGWVGLGTVTAAAIIGAWFETRRGLAISLAFSGATSSGIVLMPALVMLVETVGFRNGLAMAALVTAIVIVPIVVVTIRSPPQGDGRSRTEVQPVALPSRRFLMRDAGFWLLTAPLAMALFVQVAFIVHQIAILTPLIGFQATGAAVSLTTAMALIGRVGLGVFIDRVDPRLTAAASMSSQAVALALIGWSRSPEALFLACAVFGFSIGNLVTLPALIVQREYAPPAFSLVLGLSMGISGFVNSCGPAAMGALRDLTGGYAVPILIGVAIELASAVTVLMRPPATAQMI